MVLGEGILIVCGQLNLCNFLLNLVSSAIPGPHVKALSGAEARRKTSQSEFAATLIAGRMADGTAIDLALDFSRSGSSGVMVVTERDELFDAHDALDGSGVTILSKPLSKDALVQSIRLILRVAEGGGTVEKAKLMLITHKNFNEPQAHRYIQKISMDKRLPREIAAQLVIKSIEQELGENK